MSYLSPPMWKDVAALLGDFVALYEERNVNQTWIQHLKCCISQLRGESVVTASMQRVSDTAALQDLRRAREEK